MMVNSKKVVRSSFAYTIHMRKIRKLDWCVSSVLIQMKEMTENVSFVVNVHVIVQR